MGPSARKEYGYWIIWAERRKLRRGWLGKANVYANMFAICAGLFGITILLTYVGSCHCSFMVILPIFFRDVGILKTGCSRLCLLLYVRWTSVLWTVARHSPELPLSLLHSSCLQNAVLNVQPLSFFLSILPRCVPSLCCPVFLSAGVCQWTLPHPLLISCCTIWSSTVVLSVNTLSRISPVTQNNISFAAQNFLLQVGICLWKIYANVQLRSAPLLPVTPFAPILSDGVLPFGASAFSAGFAGSYCVFWHHFYSLQDSSKTHSPLPSICSGNPYYFDCYGWDSYHQVASSILLRFLFSLFTAANQVCAVFLFCYLLCYPSLQCFKFLHAVCWLLWVQQKAQSSFWLPGRHL